MYLRKLQLMTVADNTSLGYMAPSIRKGFWLNDKAGIEGAPDAGPLWDRYTRLIGSDAVLMTTDGVAAIILYEGDVPALRKAITSIVNGAPVLEDTHHQYRYVVISPRCSMSVREMVKAVAELYGRQDMILEDLDKVAGTLVESEPVY